MGRKSRLKHKKRYYLSKPAKLIVSVPLEKLRCTYLQQLPELQPKPPQLIVLIPLTQYIEAPVDSLRSLMQRVRTFGFGFSSEWVHVPSVTPELIVCRMEVYRREPVAVITVRVADDLSWILTALGREVEMPEALDIQKHVGSVAVLSTILNVLQGYQICNGNPEQEYIDLCNLRHGKFNDRTGT